MNRAAPDPFPNVRALCYFNSLLQCVLAALGKRSILKLGDDPRPVNLVTLVDINRRLKKKKCAPLTIGQHQCAGEMYTLMMTAYEDFPLFTKLFFYETTSIRICQNCGDQNKTYEMMNVFVIENAPNAIASLGPRSEFIDFRCEKCTHQRSVLYTSLTRAPTIMVFQVKIDNESARVKFPEKIKMESKLWDVRGFVHHVGNNDGGHYRASIKLDKKWWVADDESIYEIDSPLPNICMAFYTMQGRM